MMKLLFGKRLANEFKAIQYCMYSRYPEIKQKCEQEVISVRIGLLDFVPETSILKMNLALVGQPLKKSMKFLKKIEIDRHISSRDIATELNVDHKRVLNHLHKFGCQKKLDIWVNVKAFNGPSFHFPNYANRRKTMDFSSEMKQLRSIYPSLVNDMLDEQLIYHQNMPDVRERYANMMDYTLNLDDKYYSTALMTIRSYKLFEKPSLLSEENLKLASILGWCFRISETAMIIVDDIYDNAHYRYNKNVWFRLPNVGIITAVIDASVLKAGISYLLFKYFATHPQYFNIHKHVIRNYATTDVSTTLETLPCKLHEYERNQNIVKAYTFTVPIILAPMYMANIVDPRLHAIAEKFLRDYSEYFVAEDDMEGIYGKIEKDSNDESEGKITWMAIQVCKRGTKDQKDTFMKNYGRKDKESISNVFKIYDDLNLRDEFAQYKERVYEQMYKRIEDFPKDLPPGPFLDILDYGMIGGFRS